MSQKYSITLINMLFIALRNSSTLRHEPRYCGRNVPHFVPHRGASKRPSDRISWSKPVCEEVQIPHCLMVWHLEYFGLAIPWAIRILGLEPCMPAGRSW